MDPGAVMESEALLKLKVVDEAIEKGESTVQKFYENAVILITGGSGFLGKQLIEKLLRSCNIKKIYILLRQKKGKTVEHRFAKLLESPVFDSVRQKKPWFEERLVLLEGDVIEPKLGISEAIWNTLTEEVDIIFHTAATVNFKDTLRTSTLVNVRGTMKMLNFGKACRNLRSFVHVSTAFCHSTDSRKRSVIPEEFYPSPVSPTTLVELAENFDESTLERIAPMFLKEGRNSYMFTKAMAEEAVRTLSGDIPICIVRPSIVISSYLEPAPGWVDINNIYGPSGIVLGLGLGVLHVIITDVEIIIDLVPVDIVNNGIIVAGWETGTRAERDVKIYTVTASRKQIQWSSLFENSSTVRRYISPRAVWYSFWAETKNKYIFILLSWLLHFIPGALADGVILMIGKKPIALQSYRTVYNLQKVLQNFTCNYWIFDDKNFIKMQNKMSETDKKIFNIDIMSVDMKEMTIMWYVGLRKYIIKDGLNGNEYARRKQVFLKVVTYVLGPLYFFFTV